MANALLDAALPEDLADRGQAIETKGNVEDFGRLSRIVAADLAQVGDAGDAWRQAPVAIRLGFGWADARRQIPAVTGRLVADICTVCQRCLEPFQLRVETELNLLLMKSGGTSDGHEEFEVWEYEDDTLRPVDIVEEALIMALPLSAMHDSRDDCGVLADTLAEEEVKTVRPFANLRSQMETPDATTDFSGSGKKPDRQ